MLAGDLTAEHVDGERVADLEAEGVGDLGIEGDQRRAAIIRPATSGRRRCWLPGGSGWPTR